MSFMQVIRPWTVYFTVSILLCICPDSGFIFKWGKNSIARFKRSQVFFSRVTLCRMRQKYPPHFCRIHRLLLCRGVRPPLPQRVSWYDTKQFDGEVPAMLELWGMRSTPSLSSLPGPLWLGVVAHDRALSMG